MSGCVSHSCTTVEYFCCAEEMNPKICVTGMFCTRTMLDGSVHIEKEIIDASASLVF
jgi:hypothetical protein